MGDEGVRPVDPEHPWAEASNFGGPRPVSVWAKCEAYEVTIGDKTVDAGLLTFVTPIGVLTLIMTPQVLGMLTLQCAEVMDQITAPETGTPNLVLADSNMMRQEAERARAAEALRSKG